MVVGDVLAIAATFWVASLINQSVPTPEIMVTLPVTYFILACVGRVHASIRAVERSRLMGRFVVFWLQAVMGLALFHLLVDPHLPHVGGAALVRERANLLVSGLLLPCLVAFRVLVLFASHRVQHQGRNQRHVLIAGTGETAQITAEAIKNHPGWGIKLLGFMGTRDDPMADPPRPGMNVVGHFSDLPKLINDMVVDEVVVADPGASLEVVEEVVRISETIGLRAFVVADFCQTKSTTIDRTDLAGRTLLVLTPFPDHILGGSFKRAVDIFGSAAGLIVLSPLLLLISLLVKFSSAGPVLYAQTRLGRNGRPFKFYKFRTMVQGADAMKNVLMAQNEMDGPVFKMRNDPRVTRIGRILRRYSLDEFPQLWNVLVGDMSLVGPRPPVPQEVASYETWQRRRLSMKPGLTCVWQVSGRNDTDFQTWMRQDLEYIDNWSFSNDMKILLKTVPAVLSGRGAS